jgi:hypothetical protein
MSILEENEIKSVLKIESVSNYPELIFLSNAVDEFIKTATGKDWGASSPVDPIAKMTASTLLARWFQDPSMMGKINDSVLISLIGQLHAKAISEVNAV